MHDLILPMRAIDDTLKGTNLDYWSETTIKAAEKLGRSWRNSANYVRYFEEAGFVDVVEKHFQWPMNTWPKGERLKTLGSYWLEVRFEFTPMHSFFPYSLTRAREKLYLLTLGF